MRDFERLEELSSTVRSGLEASSVIWAIDQALAGTELDAEAIAAIESGRDMLKTIADPATAAAEPDAPLAQNMLGGDSVPTVRSMIEATLSNEDEDPSKTFKDLAEALETVRAGDPADSVKQELEQAVDVFATISAIRLGQAGGISRANREQASWLPKMTTSPSS